ncbi:hypothetical protein TNCV_2244681 [Trichonephila clavipes]|nr:hypothetical protein TNCV_2244681 [Trichonephila clavipes]
MRVTPYKSRIPPYHKSCLLRIFSSPISGRVLVFIDALVDLGSRRVGVGGKHPRQGWRRKKRTPSIRQRVVGTVRRSAGSPTGFKCHLTHAPRDILRLLLLLSVSSLQRGRINEGETRARGRTATAGSDVVESGRPIFDDFFQHLWPYIGNNTANVVFQMVNRGSRVV